MRSVILFGVAVFGLAACQTMKAEGPEVAATWKGAEVAIPRGNGPDECAGHVEVSCLAKLTPPKSLPVVVYAHGCTGHNYGMVEKFMALGYVAVAPSSFRRSNRKADCAPMSDKQHIMRMRFEEMQYAAQQLKQLPWVDKNAMVLAGFSEGGVTAALYPGDEYVGRIILGWTCRSSSAWWSGISGPRKAPVLAIVGAGDSYYRGNTNSGKCSVDGRPNSASLVVDAGHNVEALPESWQAIEGFLRTAVAH